MTGYQYVQSHGHEHGCRRGVDPTSPHYGLDRERCLRCRNLWARLLLVATRRRGHERTRLVCS